MAVLLLGLAVTGCGGADQQGNPSAQMSSWVQGTSFGGSVTALQADMKKADQVIAAGSAADVHTVGGVLLLDVEQANSTLPSPDQQATDLLSSAFDNLGAAAHECYDSPGSPAKRVAFAQSREKGLAALTEGVARVEAVLGKPLSQVGGATYDSAGSGNLP